MPAREAFLSRSNNAGALPNAKRISFRNTKARLPNRRGHTIALTSAAVAVSNLEKASIIHLYCLVCIANRLTGSNSSDAGHFLEMEASRVARRDQLISGSRDSGTNVRLADPSRPHIEVPASASFPLAHCLTPTQKQALLAPSQGLHFWEMSSQ